MKQYSADISVIVEANSEEEAKELIMDGNVGICESDICLIQIGSDDDDDEEDEE